jgi:hypothetical protein
MLKALTVVCVSLAVATLPAFSQERESPPADQKTALNVTGTVKTFEVGKSIEVDAKGTAHKYDLTSTDMTYTISPDVKVGMTVKLMESKDASGRTTVTIEPVKKPTGD